MTIKQAISKAVVELKTNKIEGPNLKARMLMQFVLDKPRQYILVRDNEILDIKTLKQYNNLVGRLCKNIPIEHITNMKEFMKMNFYVNEDVLIPRQDTEVLVEEVIEIAKKENACKILDLCTGSGAIAVALGKYIPNADITAVDISNKALSVAKLNAKKNEVTDKITFVLSDMFKNISKCKYDIIVSNPPYIKTKVCSDLDEQVKKEPILALDGGEDGLKFYKTIIKEGYEFLKYNGYICLEIGYDQKIDVIELMENQCSNIYSKKDMYQNDRIVIGKVGD